MLDSIDLVIGMARDYSLETRIRVLVDAHRVIGEEPRTLVMNAATWHLLRAEIAAISNWNTQSYFWVGNNPKSPEEVTFFKGIPILLKDFVADMEVIVGV